MPSPLQHVPALLYSGPRDSKTGMLCLKFVNRASTGQPVRVEVGGLAPVEANCQIVALSAARGRFGEGLHEESSAVLHYDPRNKN